MAAGYSGEKEGMIEIPFLVTVTPPEMYRFFLFTPLSRANAKCVSINKIKTGIPLFTERICYLKDNGMKFISGHKIKPTGVAELTKFKH